jgi:hypothetical protein
MNNLIKELLENNCDYEYYPTTQEIVNVVADKIIDNFSGRRNDCNRILDIGCGKGDFFEKLEKASSKTDSHGNKTYLIPANEKFGIEKSPVLIEHMPDNIILLGTDFHEQTLIDKQMDLIFCNPPYSEYEDWTERIIREGNAPVIILVIPDRWKKSELIKEALKKRNFKAENIGDFDFIDAERKARANVNVLYVCEDKNGNHHYTEAFDTWFDDTFKISAETENESGYMEEHSKSEIIANELIQSENIAEQLVSFYQKDTEHLFNNYKALENLDYDLLKVLNVDIKNLKESLKEKIKGLKHVYWEQLFVRYNEITGRLTSYSRERFLDKLHSNADIDFTLNNIYAVTLWIIKHSNAMYDDQLKAYYMGLADEDSITMYKSDKRFTDDEWRYLKSKVRECSYNWKENHLLKNFMYDYRIVYKKCYRNYDRYGLQTLSNSAFDFVWDTIHIAENLGFSFSDTVFPKNNRNGTATSEYNLLYENGRPFVNIKLYQNGNIHLKFDMDFMKRMNIEAARLFGWITNRKEAAEEMDISEADAARAWNCNAKILPTISVNLIEWKK